MPKIPSLPGPLTAPAAADQFAIEDDSTTTTKRISWETLLGAIYPVGSIYFNAAVSTNPGTLLGFGTWVAYAAGRVPVGFDATQTEFDSLGETGGSKTNDAQHTHTGTTAAMSSLQAGVAMTTGAVNINHVHTFTTNNGGSTTQNNLQPYITVYMWKRTA